MPTSPSSLRTCSQGHQYYKSSDCPVCPICEKAVLTANDLPQLGAPARRALENAGIHSLAELARHSEAEILDLHGIGPSSMPKLRSALEAKGLSFKPKP
jgi:predicted RecB family nuclease